MNDESVLKIAVIGFFCVLVICFTVGVASGVKVKPDTDTRLDKLEAKIDQIHKATVEGKP